MDLSKIHPVEAEAVDDPDATAGREPPWFTARGGHVAEGVQA